MSSAGSIAAIDIGTSSVHMAIVRPSKHGRPEVLAREKLPVRLGSGPSDMKALDPAAIDRAIDALSRFRAIADADGADVVAMATSAVREAEDPDTFLDRARTEAGITVEVISGVEEGRLIHLGVLGALPLADVRHLVIDIGGGSTELVVGDGTEPVLIRSLKLGHVRLTDRFFPDGHVDQESIDECRRFVRSFLARTAMEARAFGFQRVAVCSGTFESIAGLAMELAPEAELAERRDNRISADAARRATAAILTSGSNAERAQLPSIDEHRADTIVAGAILVEVLLDVLFIETFEVSPDALREGIVLDHLQKHRSQTGSLHHLDSIRASSVDQVAERHGEVLEHVRQSTDVALQLFDATAGLHGLDAFARDILEAAGMLHNIGRFVGHGAHHKHSYYLIRNSEHLAGFTQHELELIAQVARYHRKSEPSARHREFRRLSAEDQQLVVVLAGMLRIGIGLDRTYRNLATDLDVSVASDEVLLSVTGQPEELELEIFAANERRKLLERGLGRAIRIVAVPKEQHP